MKSRTRRMLCALPTTTALIVGSLAFASSAHAAETDISVNYETQNFASAATDGSYTVHGRVGQLRDDMKVSYTIETDTVQYPVPVIEYTGDFTDTSDASYSFRFSCVVGTPCEAYQYQVDAMNTVAATLDGNSIATFTNDVTPIIDAFGGNVPVGVSGTVTVSILSDVPGEAQLRFWLEERDTQEALSQTIIAPLSITEPVIGGTYTPAELCVAGLVEYIEDGVKYTPTNLGRDAVNYDVEVTDLGILPDDATPVGTTGTYTYAFDGGTPTTLQGVIEQELAASAGNHDIVVNYVAPDGVTAAPISGTVTVLGADSVKCWTTSNVASDPDTSTPSDPDTSTPSDPEKPKPTVPETSDPEPVERLETTGGGNTSGLMYGGIAAMLLGAATVLSRRLLGGHLR